MYLARKYWLRTLRLRDLLLETGPPFYVVMGATLSSTHLQGKGSTFISQLFWDPQYCRGGSRGGARGTQPPLIFRPDWGSKGRKKNFGDTCPRLSKGLDDQPPPPPPRLISRSGSGTVLVWSGPGKWTRDLPVKCSTDWAVKNAVHNCIKTSWLQKLRFLNCSLQVYSTFGDDEME